MMYEKTLWQKALELLENQIATASYNGFIVELEPLCVKNDDFYLVARNHFNRLTLQERYVDIISKALSDAAGKRLNAIFILPSERDKLFQSESGQQEYVSNMLNPRYTFETFVIGSSNRFAHAAAQAVSNNPGYSYNPLFIYGGVGLGKTHLMHAIGNAVLSADPSKRIIYATTESFMNELIEAIRSDRNIQFREKYRKVDVLMLDDIQFISNKEGTQEEFFHTFNALYDAHRQIVISSDKPPAQIPLLEERLRTRFEWGLIADIQPPDHETRVAILQQKAMAEGIDISTDVLHYIATIVNSNIRVLEGSLTRVIAYSSLYKRPLTSDIINDALKDYIKTDTKRAVNADYIKETVCEYYEITLDELNSSRRTRSIAYPRQIAVYLCRKLTDMSLPAIGEAFGRDHSTIMHACKTIEADRESDAELRRRLDDIIKRLQS